MWQFIVIIKFEKAYLCKPDVFKALMQFIRNSLMGQSDTVNVTICIYTDVQPTLFLESLPSRLPQININSKYILFLNRNEGGHVIWDEKQVFHATLSGTSIPVSFSPYQPIADLLRPQELGSLFKKLKPEHRQDKTLLFLLDHGSGFAIFGEPDFNPTLVPKSVSNNVSLIDTQIRKLNYYDFGENDVNITERFLNADEIENRNQFNKSLPSYSESTDPVIFFKDVVVEPLNLTMDELAQALDIAKFNPDVLVLANCFMFCIDTLYALKNSAKILISSSTAITYEIFDIGSILKSLPGKDIYEASLLFIDTAKNSPTLWKPDDTIEIKELVKERIALYAFDLTLMNQHNFWATVHDCIQLIIELFSKDQEKKLLIVEAASMARFNVLINYSLKYFFIDFFKFFFRVQYETQHLFLQENAFDKLNTFKTIFGFNTNSQFIGSIVSDSNYSCGGPSIMFPFGKNDFDCRFIRIYYNGSGENPYRNSFCRDYNWDYFLYLWFSFKKD